MSQTYATAGLLCCGLFLGLISLSPLGATQAAQPKSKQVLKHLPFERLNAVDYVATISHSMPPRPDNPLKHGETLRVQARRPNALKTFVPVPKDSGGQSLGQVYRHEIVIGDQATRWELTLDKKTNLPIRLSTFIRMKKDPWHEMVRTDFSKWNLHPTFGAETFHATIPEGCQLKK